MNGLETFGLTVALGGGTLFLGEQVVALVVARRRRPAPSETAPPPIFRRPAEFGPLRLPWDQVEQLRVAILADQLAEGDDTAVCVDLSDGRVGLRPANPGDLADQLEGLDVARQRVLLWLAHWQADAIGGLVSEVVPVLAGM